MPLPLCTLNSHVVTLNSREFALLRKCSMFQNRCGLSVVRRQPKGLERSGWECNRQTTEGSPQTPAQRLLHPNARGWERGETRKRNKDEVGKSQLLCLTGQRSERKNSEFGMVCVARNIFERGGLAGVSWDLLTGGFLTVDGQMNSVMEALVESGKARWKLAACL